jgi:hypothetical protein
MTALSKVLSNQLLLLADACLEEVKMASAYDNSSSQKEN